MTAPETTVVAPPPMRSGRPRIRETGPLHRDQILTVARTDLKQLIQAKDFWIPMILLGGTASLAARRHDA